MIATRWYKPLAFLLFGAIILLTQFINAVIGGQILFPAQFAWLVTSGILIGYGLITVLRDEVQTLDPDVAKILADATADASARGAVVGVASAGGLPASMLTPRPDVQAAPPVSDLQATVDALVEAVLARLAVPPPPTPEPAPVAPPVPPSPPTPALVLPSTVTVPTPAPPAVPPAPASPDPNVRLPGG